MNKRFWIAAICMLACSCDGRLADLRLCDAEIQRGLKAPATYKRVDVFGGSKEKPEYLISYDAENSFGVPLRAWATCHVSDYGNGKTVTIS